MRTRVSGGCASVVLLLIVFAAFSTSASAAKPWWSTMTSFAPTDMPPGGEGSVAVVIANVGDAAASGGEVVVKDHLPAKLTAVEASMFASSFPFGAEFDLGPFYCSIVDASDVSCSYPVSEFPLKPYEHLEVVVRVAIAADAVSGEANEVSVEGGEAQTTKVEAPEIISEHATPFGFEPGYSLVPEEEGGGVDNRAGSHPFQLTATVSLNQAETAEKPPALAKDLNFDLPPGLVGDANVVTQCTDRQFATEIGPANECPVGSAIGVAIVRLNFVGKQGHVGQQEVVSSLAVPVFNLTPAPGEPARFGFLVETVPIILKTAVRSGRDYGALVSLHDNTQGAVLLSTQLSLWGVPGESSHDNARGWGCLDGLGACQPEVEATDQPLLTMPTRCGPFTSDAEGVSWSAPGVPSRQAVPADFELGAQIEGCHKLSFEPGLSMAPETDAPNAPTGLAVEVALGRLGDEGPAGLAESDVHGTTATLPPALQVNPAAAAGMVGCGESDIGVTGYDAGNKATQFSEETEQERHGEAPHSECPAASKIGRVTVTTPLLSEPLSGWVYQAAQDENPFGSLLAIYAVAEAPRRGVRVRLAGEVTVKPDGQLITTFANTPQLPFEHVTVRLFGGERAALATTACGSYPYEALFEPWSGGAVKLAASQFLISARTAAGCAPSAFAPRFLAGTVDNNAGAYSPFVFELNRSDGEQSFGTVQLRLPPGLSAAVSSVEQCPQQQASVGACPAASKIGHVELSAGVGSEPIALPEAGRPEDPVYLTGPYEGAPFGLAIVVPAQAGPFDLDEGGHPVVIRARIDVDPHTTQVSIVSDPLPTRLQGIPLDVRSIAVTIDRSDFAFNPTRCDPTSVAGVIDSSAGATESVSSRFQAADCERLPFHPSFRVWTEGKTSKADGASLEVKVDNAAGSANVREVHVSLPTQLPSRLETLKLACVQRVFEANPALCPAASAVGTATAITPILVHPMTGPAYLVSHGGAEFPDLEIVLQGEGVTMVLDGNTDVEKDVTSSTFRTIPDEPVGSFELRLPEGPHSVLGAPGGKLCSKSLVMPTTMRAQNGALMKQSTKIAVTGCKAAVIVLRHSVRRGVATITASVPAAGTLTVGGSAVSRVVRRTRRAGSVTLEIGLRRGERDFLSHHRGRRLRTRVSLRFVPRAGKTLTTGVTLLIG